MIQHVQGDIFRSDAELLVNPVNLVGVSGKGLAAQFRQRYPKAQRRYEAACRDKTMRIGRLLLAMADNEARWIAYFPTKTHWRYPSQPDYIIDGLVDLRAQIVKGRFASVAVPALGCGEGGLPWVDVRTMISATLSGGAMLDVDVDVYTPRIVR